MVHNITTRRCILEQTLVFKLNIQYQKKNRQLCYLSYNNKKDSFQVNRKIQCSQNKVLSEVSLPNISIT